MPKVSPIQGNFNGGEISPLLYGRVDSERYKIGLAKCENYIPTIQGGLTRRPGSYFINETKTSSKASRLIDFEFSVEQAYILEFGDQYIRFYRNQGQIQVGLAAVEITSPYLEKDLFQLKMVQSADVLYIVHPDYAPRKLSRSSHTVWTLTKIDFKDGPYFKNNLVNAASTTTLVANGLAGAGLILTASSTYNINGPSQARTGTAGFRLTDVGRIIRVKVYGIWSRLLITGWISATQVYVTVVIGTAPTPVGYVEDSEGPTLDWHLGAWSDSTSYPAAICFYEQRLYFAGARIEPQRIDGSMIGDYENMSPSPTIPVSPIPAVYAISYTLSSNEVNAIQWIAADDKGLLVGTVGGEWMLRSASATETLSNESIAIKQISFVGCANLQPVQAGKSTVYAQRSGRRVRELSYFYNVDGFQSSDLNIVAEHLGNVGTFIELAYQKEPQSIVWAIRSDGTLCAMTFERDIESLKVAWHRHVLGGVSERGAIAGVESVAVIPSQDGTREEVWLIVKRYIWGEVKRYVECMTPFFDDSVSQENAFFVDCGLTYDVPIEITLLDRDFEIEITAPDHGLLDGDRVVLRGLSAQEGLRPGYSVLNGLNFEVSDVTTDTFKLVDSEGIEIQPPIWTGPYNPGGFVRRLVSGIAGLEHLKGQVVSILADGAAQPDQMVDPMTGQIELETPAATVHVGLGYKADGQMLRLDAGAADGTALGKTRRTHRVGFLLHRSLGLKIGMSFDNLVELTFRTSADLMSVAPALYSGIRSEIISAEYDFENQICWRQDQPLPSTVLAIMPQLYTQDRG